MTDFDKFSTMEELKASLLRLVLAADVHTKVVYNEYSFISEPQIQILF